MIPRSKIKTLISDCNAGIDYEAEGDYRASQENGYMRQTLRGIKMILEIYLEEEE